MSSYHLLAEHYDQLTQDVDYSAWADYISRQFSHHPLPGQIVLDLACGTGSLTCQLAERGYEMIGVDASPDMLSLAAQKAQQAAGTAPIFLCQSMERLDLYGTVDGCVCCLDSVNYLTSPRQLSLAFGRVHLFLAPGGVFLFDVKTPQQFARMDGQISLDEREYLYCLWRTEFSKRSQLCTHCMDLFRLDQETNLWARGQELHRQRAYSEAQLRGALTQAGFDSASIRVYGDLSMQPPTPEDGRIFFVARKDA